MEINHRKQCRTCLRQCEGRKDLISLFDYDETFSSNKIQFSEMLNVISNQRIFSNDPLPKRVCILCLSNIRTSFHFRRQVEKSFEALVQQYNLLNSQELKETVKSEPNGSSSVTTLIPLIQSPRHVMDESFNCEENLLDEIDEPDPTPPHDKFLEYDSDHFNSNEENENESENEDRESEIESDANIPKDLICRICSHHPKMSNLNAYRYHKDYYHKSTKCRDCGKKSISRYQLRMHIKSRHPEKLNEYDLNYQEASVVVNKLIKFNECTTCQIKFINRESLHKHIADCDRKCAECKSKMASKENYYKHLENVHKLKINRQLECPFCMGKYDSEKMLNDHIQKMHPEDQFAEEEDTSNDSNEGKYECNICKMKFPSGKSLGGHKTRHRIPDTEIEVRNKNVIRYSREAFVEKYLVRKNNLTYHCLPCKTDIHRASLYLHLKSKHSAIRGYRCELCPEAFFRCDYRLRHVQQIHPNSFKCYKCNFQFDRAYKLDQHNNEQHQMPIKHTKPDDVHDMYDISHYYYKYIVDSKSYDYTDDILLVNPTRANSVMSCATNNSEVPLSKDDFIEKYIISKTDRLVQCTVCQVEIQKVSIFSHLLWKHAVQKPLKCAFCNERTIKAQARLAHMARCHPNEYKCNECKMQFAKHYQIVEHFLERHKKKCPVSKSSGEEEDLVNQDIQFASNSNEDDIENVFSTETNDTYIKCPKCLKTFWSTRNFRVHYGMMHKNSQLSESSEITSPNISTPCNDEQAPMSFEEFKNKWIEEDLSGIDVKCLVCDIIMKKKNLATHLKGRHSTNGAYLCEICREAFYTPEQRSQHMNTQHKGMFLCETCNIQFHRNSRYVSHMLEIHKIELMESTDQFEVDLNLTDLTFVPTIRKPQCDDKTTLSHSMNHTESCQSNPNADPIEEMFSSMSNDILPTNGDNNSEGLNRVDFITKYFSNVSSDQKHCSACNINVSNSSIYYHLIHFHATIFPFKCAFCDLRFERTSHRTRHMHVFHPNDYKCESCGVQFQKFFKFADHMLVEHNTTLSEDIKSPMEEDDLVQANILYVPNRLNEEGLWNEDEISNSTAVSAMHEFEPLLSQLQSVKNEINEDIPPPIIEIKQDVSISDEMSYTEFKNKCISKSSKNGDNFYKCIPCDRKIIRTSLWAHLKLWHSSKPMFNCELCSVGFRRSDYRLRHMASNHPNDYYCEICKHQFHRSVLYKEHMLKSHKIEVNTIELKSKDEIDIPLENMIYILKIPLKERAQCEETSSNGAAHIKKRRASIDFTNSPINPKGGGLTFMEFKSAYIEEFSDVFKCKICNLNFSKMSLKKHLKKFHATSHPYNCELCNESFTRFDARTFHMKYMHPDKYNCSTCNRQFYISSEFMDHMKTIHNIFINISTTKTKYDVDVPLERLRFLPRKIKLQSSEPSHQPKEPNKEQDIREQIPDDAEMTNTQFNIKFMRKMPKIDGVEPQLKCLGCKKVVSAGGRYLHILQNHVVKRQYGCDYCSLRFFSASKRIRHMAIKHPTENKCEVCSKQFGKLSELSSHLMEEHQIHKDVGDYKDTDISTENLRYTKKSTAVRTLLRENQQKEMKFSLSADDNKSSIFMQEQKCDICNVDFDSSRSFRQHMRDHALLGNFPIPIEPHPPPPEVPEEKIPQYQCEVCERKFLSLVAVNTHRKFKHEMDSNGLPIAIRPRHENLKFFIKCELCSFSSHRRDYLEQHNKVNHFEEFRCNICERNLSDSNSYIYHMYTKHKKQVDTSKLLKCDECEFDKFFTHEENLKKHRELKHKDETEKSPFYCKYCHIYYSSERSVAIHYEQHKHKKVQEFFDNLKEGKITSNSPVKTEDNTSSCIEIEEPRRKRARLETNSEEDKLDYLKYMTHESNGMFKCTICGKEKATRKFLLHHLKQHDEVPTFDCTKCSEKFVFKKKFDKHMLMHEKGKVVLNEERSNDEFEAIENEHPKFQQVRKVLNEIRCPICDITFRLTIQYNNHNNTWHGSDNPNRDLSMHAQKNKSKELIKILRCKICPEAFTKSEDLKNHMVKIHNSDIAITDEDTMKFICNKCNLTFNEKHYLDNHEKLFCIHRNNAVEKGINVNEQ